MVHGRASKNVIGKGKKVPQSADMSFRPGALVYHVLVTDEDSDQPIYPENRFPPDYQTTRIGYGSGRYAPSYEPYPAASWNVSSGFHLEVLNTSYILVEEKVALAAWVSRVCDSTGSGCFWADSAIKKQIGDPDHAVQAADYTNFNATATLANMANGYNHTVWAHMLRAGLTARVYDISDMSNAGAIESFFDAITRSITCDVSSACGCGRVDRCINGICVTNPTYSCSVFAGCPPGSFCQLNSTHCAADSKPEYGYETSCNQCVPQLNPTDFIPTCRTTDNCYFPECDATTRKCKLIGRNDTDCTCFINGTWYFRGEKDPNNNTLECDPRWPHRFIDPNNPPYNCSLCPQGTECEIVTCDEDTGCQIVERTGPDCICTIDGKMYRKYQHHPNDTNLICDPSLNGSDWTDRAAIAQCDNFTTCDECMYQSQSCGWCGALMRCLPGGRDGPRNATCPFNWVFSSSEVLSKEEQVPTAQAPVQPSRVEVFLRPGVPLTIPVKVRRPAIPPVDFYLLVDASASLGKFVKLVETAAEKIADGLEDLQQNTWLGMGAFLDKPIQPRGFWPWCFVLKELLPLSSNVTAFKNAAANFLITYNYDHPESSLEPLMLVSFDAHGKVGWRNDSVRVVMVATDTYSFEAGAENSDAIGALPPNNGDGIADGDPPGTGEGYPSREQVRVALLQNKVLPVFAVPEEPLRYWRSVVTDFGFGTIVPFEDGSEDKMVDGIVSGIEQSINTVALGVERDPHHRVKSITPSGGFSNVSEGQVVEFQVVLEAREDEESYDEPSEVILRYAGWEYTMRIIVNTKVHCKGCSPTDDTAVFDECGVCGGTGESCRGCDGQLFSDKVVDACGVCDGDNSSCIDCLGVVNGNATLDACGVCNGDSSTCLDCMGVPNGGAVVDECGVCGGDNSCVGVTTGIAIAGGLAGLAAAFAIASVIFFFVSRAHMMKIDSMLAKQLGATRSNPLYQAKYKQRTNPLYKGDQNSVEMDEK